MKNNRIQVHFERKHNVVYGYVDNMPEKLRGKGRIISKGIYALYSVGAGELVSKTSLYLQGRHKDLDDIWFCYQYDSAEEAEEAIKEFEQLIDEWNNKNNSILDNAEKEYLSAVIKPFKQRITDITKKSFGINEEYLQIGIKPEPQCFYLPNFKKGTMYKGMVNGKSYTLKELGI